MRLPLHLLAFGLALGLTACGSVATPQLATGPQGMRVADAALEGGNPAMALQWTNSILAKDPRNLDALLRNGRAQLMLNNQAGAESSYRRALEIDGRQTEARIALAKLQLGTQPEQAEKMFQAVLADEPRNLAVLNNLGVSLDLQGRHADAQLAYRKALTLSPELASARQNLGLSLALSGSTSEGVTMLGQAATRNGGDRRARDNLALALALNGRTDEAGRMLNEELNPTDASTALAGYRALAEDGAIPAAPVSAVAATAPTVAPAPRSAVASAPLDLAAVAVTPVAFTNVALATPPAVPPKRHRATRRTARLAQPAAAEAVDAE